MEEVKPSDEQEKDKEVITSLDKAAEIYKQIVETEDAASRTAAFLTFLHQYNYSLNIANEINDRQGKNRYASSDTYKLQLYSAPKSVYDEVMEEKVLNVMVSIVESYLADKKELPANEKLAKSRMTKAKALIIMLITTNQMDVIALIQDLPKYLYSPIRRVNDLLYSVREDTLDRFVEYLRKSGNEDMADIAESVGSKEFWGTDGTKSTVIYERHFGKIREKIVNPIETYNAFKKFRGEYRKSTRGVLPSKILEIFDLSKDAYQKGRRTVYNEILTNFPEETSAAKKLIFES
jgi:hypothetical protein|nr:MAG TPA: hypothetical protein [Bacteriophage sp.]